MGIIRTPKRDEKKESENISAQKKKEQKITKSKKLVSTKKGRSPKKPAKSPKKAPISPKKEMKKDAKPLKQQTLMNMPKLASTTTTVTSTSMAKERQAKITAAININFMYTKKSAVPIKTPVLNNPSK